MEEKWKNISWYWWKYQVSNLWNIRSTNYRMKKVVKNLILKSNDRYTKVDLYFQWTKTTKNVHRIVAEEFLRKPHNKSEVNHKDLDRYNNNVLNLEWVTEIENKEHYRNNRITPHNFS
jgi:hypothetical protein